MKFVLAIIALTCLASGAMATVYDRCSLARAMSNLGVPRADLNKWACIAQHESSYNTAAVGPTNYNGSNDYGIFQINDLYWCQPPSGKFSYNECAIGCDGLLTNDIAPSVRCALKVKSQQGWTAWSTWKYCDGSLPSIDDCF